MATNMVIDLTEDDQIIDLTNDDDENDHDCAPPTQHQYRHLFQPSSVPASNFSESQNFNNNVYSQIYSQTNSQYQAQNRPQAPPQDASSAIGYFRPRDFSSKLDEDALSKPIKTKNKVRKARLREAARLQAQRESHTPAAPTSEAAGFLNVDQDVLSELPTTNEKRESKAGRRIEDQVSKVEIEFREGRPFSLLDLLGRRRYVCYDSKSGELDRFWTESLQPAELFAIEKALQMPASTSQSSSDGSRGDGENAAGDLHGGQTTRHDSSSIDVGQIQEQFQQAPQQPKKILKRVFNQVVGLSKSNLAVYEEMAKTKVHLENGKPVAYTDVSSNNTHKVFYDDKGDFDRAWVLTLKPAHRLAVGKALQAARAEVLRKKYEKAPKRITQTPVEYLKDQMQRGQQVQQQSLDLDTEAIAQTHAASLSTFEQARPHSEQHQRALRSIVSDEDNNKVIAQAHEFYSNFFGGPPTNAEQQQLQPPTFSAKDSKRFIAQAHDFYLKTFDRPGAEAEQRQANESGGWADDVQPGLTFAQRMMAKMGHQQGKGLGRDGSGIVEPITPKFLQGKTGIGASRMRGSNAPVYSRAQVFLRPSGDQVHQEPDFAEIAAQQEYLRQLQDLPEGVDNHHMFYQRDAAQHLEATAQVHAQRPTTSESSQRRQPLADSELQPIAENIAHFHPSRLRQLIADEGQVSYQQSGHDRVNMEAQMQAQLKVNTGLAGRRQPLPDQREALDQSRKQPQVTEGEDDVDVQPTAENVAQLYPARIRQFESSAPQEQGFPGARSDFTTQSKDFDDVEFVSERRLAHNERGLAMGDVQRNNAIMIQDDADIEMTQMVVHSQDSGPAPRSQRARKNANLGQMSPGRSKDKAERRPGNKPLDENRVVKRRTPPREEIRMKKEKKRKTLEDVSVQSNLACQLRLNKHLASFPPSMTDAQAWAKAIEFERARLIKIQQRRENKAELNGTPKSLGRAVQRTAEFLESIEDPNSAAAIAAQAASERFVAENTKKTLDVAKGKHHAKKMKSTKAAIQNLRTNLKNLCATFGVESEQYRNFKIMVEETIAELEHTLATGFTEEDPLAALTSALTIESASAASVPTEEYTMTARGNDNDDSDSDSEDEGGVGLFGSGGAGLVEDATTAQARANRAEQLQKLKTMHSGATQARAERADELQQLRALLGEMKLEVQ